jgi:hypothetical protein
MADPATPYAQLAELLERELELVRAHSIEPLAELHAAQAALRDALPATPPPAARRELDRCRDLQRRIEQELLGVRESLLIQLRQVGHAQRAARGYQPMRAAASRVVARA